jgi:hypothetical protein
MEVEFPTIQELAQVELLSLETSLMSLAPNMTPHQQLRQAGASAVRIGEGIQSSRVLQSISPNIVATEPALLILEMLGISPQSLGPVKPLEEKLE